MKRIIKESFIQLLTTDLKKSKKESFLSRIKLPKMTQENFNGSVTTGATVK